MTSQPAPKSSRPVDLDDEAVDTNDVGDPKRIGKYDILRKLGQGGMGAVFLARDAALRRDVALKVLPKDKAENPILVRRFQAEAQAAAKLRHDNIVAVFDSDTADGYCYIAMEYVDGKDLHEMVSRRGPVPVRRSIEIIKQVAMALQHAYEHNIVHRDIKPSNLLIRRDGVVKLTDLGLARSVDDSIETGITRAGTTVGTVDYMAPEQGRSSKAADIRSDLYSLGCTWYFMLTGQPPFPDGSLTNKLQAHAVKPPPDPRTLNENVSDGLVAVIHQMLAKKPESRYQTPQELLDDLQTAALTRNAISREIFDEPDMETPLAMPERAGKKPGLPDDALPIDVPSRPRGSVKKSRVEEEYEESEPTPRDRSAKKNADVDIYTEIPDEKPVRRLRAAASTEHVEHERTEAVGTSSSTGKHRPREAGVMPPPSRRTQPEDVQEEAAGINLEWLKIVAVVAGVVVVVGGLGWMISSYSGQLLGFTPPPARPLPTPVADGGGKPGVEIAPVGGGPGGNAPMMEGGVAVAQVYGPGTTIGPDGNPLPQAGNVTGGVNADGSPQSTQQTTIVPGAGGPPIEPEKIPEWSLAPEIKHKNVVTVGLGATSGSHFSALSEALGRVSPDGGLIQLVGNGPFILSTPVMVTTKRLVIAAEPNAKPVIVFGAVGEGLAGSLRVSGGHLELNGLHISIDRESFQGTEPVKAIAVVEGALTVRDCSATVSGKGAAPLSLFSLESNAPGAARLLIERTLIRGEPTAAIDVRCNVLDAVVRDSVIACGAGMAFRLAMGSTGNPPGKGPARAVRSIHSTWCSANTIFDISGDAEREAAPNTHFVLTESVCTTGTDQGPRVMLSADGWLQDPLRQSVVWTSKASAYLGFESLVDLGSKSAFRVRNADDWRLFWQQKIDADQFHADVWPAGVERMSAVAALDFDRDRLPGDVLKAARTGESIGTSTIKMVVSESTHPLRLAALSNRRPLPNAAVQASPAAKTRRVDLKKEDLGVVLSRADWTNGTVFEAAGFGNCLMSPVQLNGRHLRLVFQQADGAPLKIVPKDAGKDVEALIRIEKGSIEIEDLRYQPPEPRSTLPAWLLSAVDSQVVLRQCEFIGPEKLTAPFLGAVKFSTAATASAQPPTLSIMQCLMQSPGTMFRVEGGAAAVFIRNSVLASRGTLLDVRPVAVQNALPVSIDIVQSTLSATDTVFHQLVTVISRPPTSNGVQYFVENCVFGPPFSTRPGDASMPTLMTLSGSVRDQQQLVWWGQANGVSREYRTLLKTVNPDAPSVTEAAAWSAVWGEGHDLQLLAVADGIIPQEPLPTRRESLKTSSYTLHPACKATTWADGHAIGAITKALASIGPQKPVVEAAPPTAKKATPPATKGGGVSKTGGF